MMKNILAIAAAGVMIASFPSAAWARGGHGHGHYAGHGHHRVYAPVRIRGASDPYGYGYNYRPFYGYPPYEGAPVFVSIVSANFRAPVRLSDGL